MDRRGKNNGAYPLIPSRPPASFRATEVDRRGMPMHLRLPLSPVSGVNGWTRRALEPAMAAQDDRSLRSVPWFRRRCQPRLKCGGRRGGCSSVLRPPCVVRRDGCTKSGQKRLGVNAIERSINNNKSDDAGICIGHLVGRHQSIRGGGCYILPPTSASE